MSIRRGALVLALAMALLAGPAAGGNRQADHHLYTFHGTVTETAPGHHWLQIHTRSGTTMRFQTRHVTQWDGCDWKEMRHGHGITVRAYSHGGSWIAAAIGHRRHHDQHHAGSHL